MCVLTGWAPVATTRSRAGNHAPQAHVERAQLRGQANTQEGKEGGET